MKIFSEIVSDNLEESEYSVDEYSVDELIMHMSTEEKIEMLQKLLNQEKEVKVVAFRNYDKGDEQLIKLYQMIHWVKPGHHYQNTYERLQAAYPMIETF